MPALYDNIGQTYTLGRKTDPRLAEQFWTFLHGAENVLNIGAGSGSYEPTNIAGIALEPSMRMIEQRQKSVLPVVQGVAESLPFADSSFSHTMTILSMHHWSNITLALDEIKRVTRDQFVALTWDPRCSPFWLTRDYFPEFYQEDLLAFPDISLFEETFEELSSHELLIPEDCQDGFLAAHWKRPHAYLNQTVRQSISSFAKSQGLESTLERLEADLASGKWQADNSELLELTKLDAGYRIWVAKV